jgi:8-oxo-dGTP pyrophosphatase MutT (NUDIX family)
MGIIVVVLDESRTQVLMHKREDFRLWGLPGGRIERGETAWEAAVRETQEETGYDVRIVRLVGEYLRPQYQDDLYVFEGSVIGGAAITSGPETVAVAWFDIHHIPPRLAPTSRQCIADTIANHPTVVKRELHFSWWFLIVRNLAISLRNMRNRIRLRRTT